MNQKNFTQKSHEAIQAAQMLSREYGNPQIEQAHLLYALLDLSLIHISSTSFLVSSFMALLNRRSALSSAAGALLHRAGWPPQPRRSGN